MVRYCEKCKEFHDENELCPKYREQLRQHPEWLEGAANFALVSSEYALISSQALDGVAQVINKIAGTNLTYEGTRQAARDIQVFAKLNSDSFSRSGQFANAQAAKETLSEASDGFKRYLRGRLNGTGQEVDWLRWRQGKLDSLFYKYQLPDGNVVGYDGVKINRFTGKTVERITIKAAEGTSGLHRNAVDIVEAIEKGHLSPNDSVYGVDGLKDELQKALDNKIKSAQASGNTDLVRKLQAAKKDLKVTEMGTSEQVKRSTEQLTNKIQNGQANTHITGAELGSKMAQGAVIGAAVGLTISGITNYIRYKNGEISEDEAFRDIGEDTTKGLLTGGAMAGVTLFLSTLSLPGGQLGYIGGMAIGMYLNAACTNVLDEVFGKGAYEQILNACGYVTGTAKNISELLREYQSNMRRASQSSASARRSLQSAQVHLDSAAQTEAEIKKWMEEHDYE